MRVKEVERFEGLVPREGGFKNKNCAVRARNRKMEVGLKREEEKRGMGGVVGWLVDWFVRWSPVRVCGVRHPGSQLSPSAIIVI